MNTMDCYQFPKHRHCVHRWFLAGICIAAAVLELLPVQGGEFRAALSPHRVCSPRKLAGCQRLLQSNLLRLRLIIDTVSLFNFCEFFHLPWSSAGSV